MALLPGLPLTQNIAVGGSQSPCCKKGNLFQGTKVCSCLILRSGLSEETRADNARDFIGKVRPGGGQEGKGTQENCSALPPDSQSRGFHGDEISFRVSLTNHSDSESFLVQPRWMPVRRILGGGRTCGVSF